MPPIRSLTRPLPLLMTQNMAEKVFQNKAEKAEEWADVAETKILELKEQLRVATNNLKSLEVAEEKANQREKSYKVPPRP